MGIAAGLSQQKRLTLEVALLAGAFIAALFFNGMDIYFFALSLGAVAVWAMVIHRDFYALTHPLPVNLFTLCFFGFWLWLGISSLFATVSYVSMVNFWWVGSLFVVAVIYFASGNREALWRWGFNISILTGTVLAGVALYQYFYLQGAPSASFLNKNSLAALFNLLLFVLIARLCQDSNNTEDRPTLLVLLIFLFAFCVGVIASRGAFLAFWGALAVFLVMLYRRMSWRQRSLILVTCVLAFMLANLLSDFSLSGKLNTLSDMQDASLSRLKIWRPAWQMFLESPWYGVGLGAYWLAWPAYRQPSDLSAGFYVHNDYLQIAIETGYPGFVLMLGMLVGLVFWFVRTRRRGTLSRNGQLELTGIFCALLAVAAHSFVSFNLYILPIDLLVGLYLGRFAWLAQSTGSARIVRLRIAAWLRPRVFRLVYFTALSVAVAFFALLATDNYLFHKASRLGKQGKLQSAHQTYMLSETLLPFLDLKYYSHAQMLLRAAHAIAPHNHKAREEMAGMVEYLLDRAVELNPWRAQPHLVRGLLYVHLAQWDQRYEPRAREAFREALERDPRYLPARIELAKQLIDSNRHRRARRLIEGGLAYPYTLDQNYLSYLKLAARFYRRQGEARLADQLRRRFEVYARRYERGAKGQRVRILPEALSVPTGQVSP